MTNILKFSIFFLWFSAFFDPIGNLFYFRYISLVLALFLTFFLIINNKISFKPNLRWITILLLSILMPLYGLMIYSVKNIGLEFIDTSYIAAGLILITSLLYYKSNFLNSGIKALVINARILSLIILSAFILDIFFNNNWVSFFTERDIARVSFREYGNYKLPYIYFLASPLLIFLISYDYSVYKKNKKLKTISLFLISTLALFLSGTRAHMIIAVLFIPIYHLLSISFDFKKIFYFTSILGAFILIFLLNSDIKSIIDLFFSVSETSNFHKISMLKVYGKIFSEPANLLIGQGYNAHEWSYLFRSIISTEIGASKTELTYIEIIRVYGVFVSSLFFVLISYVVVKLKSSNREFKWFYIAFLLTLINSSINPYFFSTNGILPLCIAISIPLFSSKFNES